MKLMKVFKLLVCILAVCLGSPIWSTAFAHDDLEHDELWYKMRGTDYETYWGVSDRICNADLQESCRQRALDAYHSMVANCTDADCVWNLQDLLDLAFERCEASHPIDSCGIRFNIDPGPQDIH